MSFGGNDRHELTDKEIERMITYLRLKEETPPSFTEDVRLHAKLVDMLYSRQRVRAMPKPCGEIVLQGGGTCVIGREDLPKDAIGFTAHVNGEKVGEVRFDD